MESLEDQLNQARNQIKLKESEISDLEQDLETARGQADNAMAECERVFRQCSDLRAQLDKKSEEVQKTNEEVTCKSSILKDQEISRLKSEVFRLKAQLDEKYRELEQANERSGINIVEKYKNRFEQEEKKYLEENRIQNIGESLKLSNIFNQSRLSCKNGTLTRINIKRKKLYLLLVEFIRNQL
jgi:predicted nuclease with TOPRIM domain